ncbi:zinc finger protein 395 [Serinus canaria]|uniref:zinc finger protein 395 n=1 Tax=Serinus canaria TaxID=9135 RepID=UPI0021CCDB11|nr:zinc finger protein 395 [Serinus canaria]
MAPVLPRRLGKRSLLGARVGPAPARILPEPSALPDPGSPPGRPQVLPTPLDERLPAFPAPSLPGSGVPERSVSCSIDVPKRSSGRSREAALEMDEMVAALVLTSLSCSPALRPPPLQGAGDPWKDSGDISDSGSSTTSGHWSSAGSATASPPHCPGSATASPPHCPGSATASPPHCPTPSPPHGAGSATPSPPHCPSSVTMSPHHHPGSATPSPPHCPSRVTMSPPHCPSSVTMSPPHYPGSATVSLPYYPGSATMSPPHCPLSATMSPHHTGSATVSPPRCPGSATVSPPRCPCAATTASPLSDDGFDTDPEPWVPEEPAPRRRKNSARLAFKCLWPGCGKVLRSGVGIKRHVRTRHLG